MADIKKLDFTKFVYGDKQFQYANKSEYLAEGFIQYHKNNLIARELPNQSK